MNILEVHGVSIRYMTGDFKDIGLKEFVMRKLTGNYKVKEFWADKNINFSLEKGEMLGIIGSNGAGKSTLLKAVSGIMEPVEGYVVRRGKIAALLELASGFDGDLTVRENAYLRGAMLGYTRKFMDDTYDQIIEFSGLQEFQDRPFKQLSSGMKSRLAFSIASMVQPEILILDEVLSVGDGAFKKKSEEKMREIISGGATTILVSHSLEQVRDLCTKVLWLEKGQQIAFGDTAILCSLYQQFLDKKITLPQAKECWQHLHAHYDWLVVGAGFYGAAFAQAMAKQGKKCLVIDRRAALGGAAACEDMDGVVVHMCGPHIFHTDDEALWKEVNGYAEFAPYDGGFGEKYQGVPKVGYGAVVEKMLAGVPTVAGVSYMALLNAFQDIADNVLYTGSPDELLMNRLGRLEYTANRYETEQLDMEDFQGRAIVVQEQNTTRCSRVIEYKYFTGSKSKKTVIAHEFPTDWVPGLERLQPVQNGRNQKLYQQYMALAEEMKRQISDEEPQEETARLLTAEAQEKTRETVEKMQKETLEKLAHAVKNLHFAGRLGEYKEYSMAESILAARNLALHLK